MLLLLPHYAETPQTKALRRRLFVHMLNGVLYAFAALFYGRDKNHQAEEPKKIRARVCGGPTHGTK